jgi:ParB family chromosome partitioning protein
LDIAINAITTKNNYRKTFNEKSLSELRASIAQHGVIEPIVVRRDGDGFQLIAGERRVRAAEMAGLVTIPARIMDVSEQKVLELQLIENIQRDNVPFFEEATAIRQLRDEQALDVKEIARILGKSEAYVYFQLSVTNLPAEARDACEKGELTKAVAWLIARIKEPGNQIKAANDLRRAHKGKLITERTARQYIQDTFVVVAQKPYKSNKKIPALREAQSDYSANWKRYLLSFDAAQFEEFKRTVSGRTEIAVWSRAVDAILSRPIEEENADV